MYTWAEAIDKTTQKNVSPTRRPLVRKQVKQVISDVILNMSLCDQCQTSNCWL